jgi:hypothetical protein
MSEPRELSKTERKKARRRARQDAEKEAERALRALADAAVEQAEGLAAEVVEGGAGTERAFAVEFETVDAARFVLRRVNEVLAVGEWLDEVDAWVWEADQSTRPALTHAGERRGIELRLEPARHHPA